MNLAYEHTAYTSMDKIMKVAKNKGYRLTSEKDLLLNYSADEVSIENEESSLKADNVSIRYSNVVTTSYKYNPTDKLYYRSVNGSVQKDYVTKKQYTTKNIIISYVDNGNISNDNKGRQELNNIGTGKGYYITDGYSIPITWTKTSRNEQTVYKKLNGEEITVNQYELTTLVAKKVEDILKLVKKNVNLLTKKEISYIIITGGLSEIRDLSIPVNNIFATKGRIGKINNVGARDNAYSVSLGMLTYFNSKLVLRNKDYSTISESDLNDLCSHNSKVGIASDSILGKVFSYFFDN